MKQEFTFYCCFPSLLSLLSELHIFLSDECSRNRHQPDNHRSEISSTCRSSRELVYHERGYSHAGGFSRGNFATKPTRGRILRSRRICITMDICSQLRLSVARLPFPAALVSRISPPRKLQHFIAFRLKQ